MKMRLTRVRWLRRVLDTAADADLPDEISRSTMERDVRLGAPAFAQSLRTYFPLTQAETSVKPESHQEGFYFS